MTMHLCTDCDGDGYAMDGETQCPTCKGDGDVCVHCGQPLDDCECCEECGESIIDCTCDEPE